MKEAGNGAGPEFGDERIVSEITPKLGGDQGQIGSSEAIHPGRGLERATIPPFALGTRKGADCPSLNARPVLGESVQVRRRTVGTSLITKQEVYTVISEELKRDRDIPA
jgi:hypothetical protein